MSLGLSPAEIVERDAGRSLPNHPDWPRVELKTVATVQNGYAFPSSNFIQTPGTPLVRIRDVKRGHTETFFEGKYPPEYLVTAGAVLIGMDGDFNCAIWPGPDALLNQRVCWVRSREGMVDERYLAYVLPSYLQAINDHTSSITVKHLSSRTVERIPIPLPPLDEQKQIVEAIETQFARLDDSVASLKRAQARLKRYRASVLKSACEGRLVPTEAELARQEGRSYEPARVLLERIAAEREAAPGKKRGKANAVAPLDTSQLPELPKGWAWIEFRELLREPLRNGHSAKTSQDGQGVPTISLTAVTVGDFSDRNVKMTVADPSRVQDLWMEPGDILIQRSNTVDLVGTARLFRGPSRFAIFPDLIIRARLSAELDERYLELVLHSGISRQYFRRKAQGISGSMPKISQETIEHLPSPIPPLAEQKRIVEEVERRLSVIEQMEATVAASLKRAESLRQSILRLAFSGRLVRPDVEVLS